MVVRALERADGRFEEAAKLLGVTRKGLFLKSSGGDWGWSGTVDRRRRGADGRNGGEARGGPSTDRGPSPPRG